MPTTTRGRPRSFDRDAALERALRLFWRRGYDGTSVRDLTDELGIGAPSLYNAFGDKETLFTEAARLYSRTYGSFIGEALDSAPTAADGIRQMLHAAAREYTRTDQPKGCLVMGADIGATSRAVTELLRGMRAEMTEAIARKITGDIEKRILPADTDAKALSAYIYTVLLGMSHAATDDTPSAQLTRTADLALRVLTR